MPPNRRLIDSKWVFKNKRYGQFRALLVVWGCTQVPGIDFTENYSPVVTDFMPGFILIMWLINKWDSQTTDIETAFLYVVLEADIYLKIPQGMEKVIE